MTNRRSPDSATQVVYLDDEPKHDKPALRALRKVGLSGTFIPTDESVALNEIIRRIVACQPRVLISDFVGPIPGPIIIRNVLENRGLNVLQRTALTESTLQGDNLANGMWIVMVSMTEGRGDLPQELRPSVCAFLAKGGLWTNTETMSALCALARAKIKTEALAALQKLEPDRHYQL